MDLRLYYSVEEYWSHKLWVGKKGHLECPFQIRIFRKPVNLWKKTEQNLILTKKVNFEEGKLVREAFCHANVFERL